MPNCVRRLFLAYKNGFLCEKIISALESNEIATIKSSESPEPSGTASASASAVQTFRLSDTQILRYSDIRAHAHIQFAINNCGDGFRFWTLVSRLRLRKLKANIQIRDVSIWPSASGC